MTSEDRAALVARLRASHRQLRHTRLDDAADLIEADGTRLALAEGTIAEVRDELDGLMSSLDDHVIADDTERENVWAAIQAVWSVLPRSAEYNAPKAAGL